MRARVQQTTRVRSTDLTDVGRDLAADRWPGKRFRVLAHVKRGFRRGGSAVASFLAQRPCERCSNLKLQYCGSVFRFSKLVGTRPGR